MKQEIIYNFFSFKVIQLLMELLEHNFSQISYRCSTVNVCLERNIIMHLHCSAPVCLLISLNKNVKSKDHLHK